MSDQAKKIIESLESGDVSEAIDLINAGIHQKSVETIGELRLTVAESYGFNRVTEKEEKEGDDDEEKKDDSKDKEEKEPKDEKSKDGDKKEFPKGKEKDKPEEE